MAQNFRVTIPIQKLDAKKRLVTGWASIVTSKDGVPIIDHDDDVILVDDLEKAVHELGMDGGAGKVSDMHESDGKASIVESMVVSKEKREALGFGTGPEGWIVTLKVHDDELMKQIESGEKAELSLKGRSKRIPVPGRPGVFALRDLHLGSVEALGIVDQGASGDSEHRPSIVLIKRRSTILDKIKGALLKTLKQEPKMPSDDDVTKVEMTLEEILAEMPDDKKAVVLAALEAAAKTEPVESIGDDDDDDDDAALKLEEEDEDMKKALKALPKEARKKLAAVLRKNRKENESETAKLQKRVKKMEDDKSTEIFVAKARDKMSALPGLKTEELGAVLKRISDSVPEKEYAEIEKCLISASEAVEKSDFLDEKGFGGESLGEDAEKLDVMIAKRQEDNKDLTYQQAYRDVTKRGEGLKLYNQIRKDAQ